MAFITLDDRQVSIVLETPGEIEVRDGQGKCLGFVARNFSPEEIAEAKRRLASSGPWYTTEQVLGNLQSLAAP